MASEPAGSAPAYKNIELLVFKIQEVLFAIDGEHVDRLVTLEKAEEEGIQLEWFHRKFVFADAEVTYKHPKVITPAGHNGRVGIVIEQPQDYFTVPVNSICPLPALFEKSQGLKPFWGAHLFGDKIILLIDFFKLFA